MFFFCLTEDPVEGSVRDAAASSIEDAASLRSTTGGDDAVHQLDTFGEAVAAGGQLQPVDGTRGQDTGVGRGGRLDVASLVHAAKEVGGRQVKGGNTAGVKVVVAQERRRAGQDTGQGEGRGGQEGIGDNGTVVRLGQGVGSCGGTGAGGVGGLQVQRDVLAPENGARNGVEGISTKTGLYGAGKQAGDVVKNGQGTGGDCGRGAGGARIVLNAVTDGDLQQLQARADSRELGTWTMLVLYMERQEESQQETAITHQYRSREACRWAACMVLPRRLPASWPGR